MKVSRATSGEWILAPSADLNSEALRAGVEALEEDLRGGPQEKISAAIMELLGATDKGQISEELATARVIALRQMAWDYPIDVVQLACRNWRRIPNQGRWWPTEQDLRAQCEPLFEGRGKLFSQAKQLLRELQTEERRTKENPRRDRSVHPRGKTAVFVDDAREKFGAAFVHSWLGVTCRFTEDTIWTCGYAVERLNQRCSGLMAKHGVNADNDSQATKDFQEDTAIYSSMTFGGKGKRG